MRTDNARCAQRTVGRLFSKGGNLHMVLEANAGTGLAKVSCRAADVTEVIDMPLSEVIDRLGSGSTLKLDKLSANETEQRAIQRDGQWFFRAREGEFGPYADEKSAKQALKRHILSAQEEGRTGRPAQAARA